MNCFPMFTDIENKDILICGGGSWAAEKIEKLLPFSPRLHIVSENISGDIKALTGITIAEHCFCESDLNPRPVFVIAAEDRQENERIVSVCKKSGIPVNAVDMPDLCDFIFPSIIKSRNLCVAVSTNGLSPTVGLKLKREFGGLIPDSIDEILDFMFSARQMVKEQITDYNKQKAVLRNIAESAFSLNRPLNHEELSKLVFTREGTAPQFSSSGRQF